MESTGNLGEPFEALVDDIVRIGRFSSRDDILRAGVRLVHEQEKAVWLADLDASIDRAIEDSEAGRVCDIEEVAARLSARYKAMAKARDEK